MLLKLIIALLMSFNFSNILVPIEKLPIPPSQGTLVPKEDKVEENEFQKPTLESYSVLLELVDMKIRNVQYMISSDPESEYVTGWQSALDEFIAEREALITERDKHYPAP